MSIQKEITDDIPRQLGEWFGTRRAKRRNHAESLHALKMAETLIANVRVDILRKYDDWSAARDLCSKAQDSLHEAIESLEATPPP